MDWKKNQLKQVGDWKPQPRSRKILTVHPISHSGNNNFTNSCIVIRLSTESNQLLLVTHRILAKNFTAVRHRLFVILLTDRQKNTHRQKDKLLSGGNEWILDQEHASSQRTVTLDALYGNSRMSGQKNHTEGTRPGQKRGRPRTSWLDHVKARTGLRLEKAIQAAVYQDNCRRVARDSTNPRTEDDQRIKQNGAYILICT